MFLWVVVGSGFRGNGPGGFRFSVQGFMFGLASPTPLFPYPKLPPPPPPRTPTSPPTPAPPVPKNEPEQPNPNALWFGLAGTYCYFDVLIYIYIYIYQDPSLSAPPPIACSSVLAMAPNGSMASRPDQMTLSESDDFKGPQCMSARSACSARSAYSALPARSARPPPSLRPAWPPWTMAPGPMAPNGSMAPSSRPPWPPWTGPML